MKKIYALLLLALFTTSCLKNDNAIQISTVEIDSDDIHGVVANGKQFYITGSNNLLTGELVIQDGGKLIIQPGSIILTDHTADNTFIRVEEGAELIINGVITNPVTITPDYADATPESWGGIIINGSNESDNENIKVKFLNIRYAGKPHTNGTQYASLTLNNIGKNDEVRNVAILSGKDAYHINGGFQNYQFLTANNIHGIAFKLSNNYNAYGHFWAAIQDENATANMMEINNASPTLSNITLVGGQNIYNVKLENNASPKIYNYILQNGQTAGISADSSVESLLNNQEALLSHGAIDVGTVSDTNFNFITSDLANTNENVVLSGYTGAIETNWFNAQSINDFFLFSPYKGAVDQNDDWTGWVVKN